MKKYFPVLLSKKGELGALQHLEQNVKDSVTPVIEVLTESLKKEIKGKDNAPSTIEYSDGFEKLLKTHWSFFGNQVVLDFSLFNGLESQISDVKKFLINIITAGVNVVPAIQSNSPEVYFTLVKDLIKQYGCPACVRISNSSGGFLNLNDAVIGIISKVNATSDNTILLLDMGQVNKDDYNLIGTVAGFAIQQLSKPIPQWKEIIVASGSFPENLTGFEKTEQEHILKRYEWLLWETLIKIPQLKGIKYGDYGTKYSYYSEATFRGTVSLKYSTKDNFIIYRGELTDTHKDGHGQYITHAQKLIKSSHYSGKDFSWGDLRYHEIGVQKVEDEKRKTGNATNWVQNSQNHHITLLNSIL